VGLTTIDDAPIDKRTQTCSIDCCDDAVGVNLTAVDHDEMLVVCCRFIFLCSSCFSLLSFIKLQFVMRKFQPVRLQFCFFVLSVLLVTSWYFCTSEVQKSCFLPLGVLAQKL
jgi:hypothetical protein